MRKVGCIGLLLGLIGIAVFAWVAHDWAGSGPADKPLAVVVPEGASLARAANELQKAGAIRSAGRFRLYARSSATAGRSRRANMPSPNMPARMMS